MTYVWEWHNHPPYWNWGKDLPDLRWSLSIAVLMLGSAMFHKSKLKPLIEPEYKPLAWLTFYILNAGLVSLVFATLPEDSMGKFDSLWKVGVNFALMLYIVRRPKDYRLIILVLLLGVANFGRVAQSEGSNRDLGIMAPNATGGNPIATHVMVSLPFFCIICIAW